MANIKDAVLRELGDEGADTFTRYYAQIEYSAYWCIRMLLHSEGIMTVVPESYDDLVIIRQNFYELHQVKTRMEKVGPWTFTEILPVICRQYSMRNKIDAECHFHFISNHVSDEKPHKVFGGSLCHLKFLLDIKHAGQNYTLKEQEEMSLFEQSLSIKIQEIMKNKFQEDLDNETAICLLHNTYIETDCSLIYKPNNIEELSNAFDHIYPGQPSHTVTQLREICGNILFVIIKKITDKSPTNNRYIDREEILNCRNKIINIPSALDLDKLPGRTTLDKKVLRSGFHVTELPRFHRQKALAEYFKRTYSEISSNKEIEKFIDELLELQGECRDDICRVQNIIENCGPRILATLKPKLDNIINAKSFPGQEVDRLLCLGLLWSETQNCNAYWHELA